MNTTFIVTRINTVLSTPSIVYQFKITLKDIEPLIWRCIQVPSYYSFWDLHIAIQDAMGWNDCHIHSFTLINPKIKQNEVIGIPDDQNVSIPGWQRSIADYFIQPGDSATYGYDFINNWFHNITLEQIARSDPHLSYPHCLDGQRACPLEDCGGVSGYYEVLNVLQNPDHEDYDDQKDWIDNQNFDPEVFDASSVHFSDPQQRLKRVAT